ncbi:hypothetical protein HMN09_00885700 [Mycena chlorophos]|uniref:Uncharacterized protein n=1 Tax=Mycena chlorophos TaxID=658473 RepID=A0A8H6SNZ6_MYCCL|nr:hypothetical protein HMN09_00885700 [Mycena chlorophos]
MTPTGIRALVAISVLLLAFLPSKDARIAGLILLGLASVANVISRQSTAAHLAKLNKIIKETETLLSTQTKLRAGRVCHGRLLAETLRLRECQLLILDDFKPRHDALPLLPSTGWKIHLKALRRLRSDISKCKDQLEDIRCCVQLILDEDDRRKLREEIQALNHTPEPLPDPTVRRSAASSHGLPGMAGLSAAIAQVSWNAMAGGNINDSVV